MDLFKDNTSSISNLKNNFNNIIDERVISLKNILSEKIDKNKEIQDNKFDKLLNSNPNEKFDESDKNVDNINQSVELKINEKLKSNNEII